MKRSSLFFFQKAISNVGSLGGLPKGILIDVFGVLEQKNYLTDQNCIH